MGANLTLLPFTYSQRQWAHSQFSRWWLLVHLFTNGIHLFCTINTNDFHWYFLLVTNSADNLELPTQLTSFS
jgi:hypothetical protein